MTDRFDYTELATNADDIVQEFGFIAATLKRKTLKQVAVPGSSPPTTVPETLAFDQKPTGTDTSYYINCVRLPISRSDRDTVIKAGYAQIDKYCKILISGKSAAVEPVITDEIELTDYHYKIFMIKPIKPYTTALLYSCYCEQL